MKKLYFILKNYINKITEEDIKKYANKQGIKLLDEETKIIYLYIKNYWELLLKDNNSFIFEELKEKLRSETYEKIIELYNKYKTQFKLN